jgi:dihydrodipicolinate synthase/N-acetylneuraminate lyase
MVKGSTGDLSRMQRVDQLSGGRLPFYNGINPLVLDALQAGAAGWYTAGPCLRPQPCIDLYSAEGAGELPRAQAIYAELLPLLEFVVAGGLATTAAAGLGLLGVGIGDPSRPLAPLDDEGPRCAEEAADRRLTASASAMRIRALRSSLRRSCTRTKRTYRELNVFGFFQYSTRVRDLRLADRYAPE